MMLFLPIGNVFEKIDLIQMYANKTKENGPFTMYVNQGNVLFTSYLLSN